MIWLNIINYNGSGIEKSCYNRVVQYEKFLLNIWKIKKYFSMIFSDK